MNVFIDKIQEGNRYVFQLVGGHTAIVGELVACDATLEVLVDAAEPVSYFLNPENVVAVRPA